MCDKSVDTHPLTIKYIPKYYNTQGMCNKAVQGCFFYFDSIPDQYRTQEICDIVVSLYPFLIVYCSDKCKTQRIYDETVDDSLAALRAIPDWFVTSKIIKKIYAALYADDGLLLFDEFCRCYILL